MTEKPQRLPAKELLTRSDPLSDDACESLIHYGEEDDVVDFKESFDTGSNSRSWIDLAVDCAAFANTHGGYLIFGVRDKTWDLVGLSPETASALADIKKVLEKVNRGLTPPIIGARARKFAMSEKEFAIVWVPPSLAFTHIFETDLTWRTPKGENIPGIRQGTIYTRRSGSNAILTSADFERLIDRRLQHFREKILQGVTRVVNAGPTHETLTVSVDSSPTNALAVRVIEAPKSLDLAGKSLSLRADSISDKINMFIAITRTETDPEIDLRLLYGLYAVREDTALNDEQKDWVIFHSIRTGVPAFFWLAQIKESRARELISAAFDGGKFWRKASILNYAGFFGERFHKKLYDKLGDSASKHGIRSFRSKRALLNVDRSRDLQQDSKNATERARTLATHHDALSHTELEKLDCSLYAPFD